jgi:hypothetical protein
VGKESIETGSKRMELLAVKVRKESWKVRGKEGKRERPGR